MGALGAASALLCGACTIDAGQAVSGPTTTTAPPATVPNRTVDPACDPNNGNETKSLRPGPNALTIGPDTYMAKIKARGKLIVGVSQDTYLFSYFNPTTKRIEGFDVDIAKEVARAIFGDPEAVELRAILYSERLPKLESGELDIVADTMTINCERWARISFSAEYYHAGQTILTRVDLNANSIGELKGRKVCAATGSTSIDNIRKVDGVIAVDSPDWVTCLVWLQQGKVDAISTDDTILAGLSSQDPHYTRVPKTRAFTDEPYGLGINKSHPEFVQFVNAVLEGLRGGRWDKIYDDNKLKSILPDGQQPEPSYRT